MNDSVFENQKQTSHILPIKETVQINNTLTTLKGSKGVVILKPARLDYGVAMVYQVIMLLKCLAKVVQKGAVKTIAEWCEQRRIDHNSLCICFQRRLPIDVF